MHDSIESLLLMASVGLAAASLWWGFQRHRQRRVFLFLAIALGLIAVGRFGVDSPYETALVVAGAATLATGHLVNRHICGTCASCECGESDRQP